MSTNLYCVGYEGFTEYHGLNISGSNSWLSVGVSNGAGNANGTTPDTAAGASLGGAGGVVLKENACGTNFANDSVEVCSVLIRRRMNIPLI